MGKIAATAFSNVLISPSIILHPASLVSPKSRKIRCFAISTEKERWRVGAALASAASSEAFNQPGFVQSLSRTAIDGGKREKATTKRRVFFLDVNPLCYEGSTPSLRNFGQWISLFFSQVSHCDPVIAVSHSPSPHPFSLHIFRLIAGILFL